MPTTRNRLARPSLWIAIGVIAVTATACAGQQTTSTPTTSKPAQPVVTSVPDTCATIDAPTAGQQFTVPTSGEWDQVRYDPLAHLGEPLQLFGDIYDRYPSYETSGTVGAGMSVNAKADWGNYGAPVVLLCGDIPSLQAVADETFKDDDPGYRVFDTVVVGQARYQGNASQTPIDVPVMWVVDFRKPVKPTTAPTPKPSTPQPQPTPEQTTDKWDGYTELSDRDWAKIEKNPDGHWGEQVVIYGVITQFDAATGPDTFRANTAGTQKSSWYDYDINTLLYGSSRRFADLVTDDTFKAWVTIEGSETYETTLGGSITVPAVTVDKIKRTG